MKTELQDVIKNRMIKKAASIWNVAPNEIESSFDPIVSLLINVCAAEISKISGEISNSENRITERLLHLMTPETLNGARPAHAIAYTEPNSESAIIAPENLFYYNKRIKLTNADITSKNIFFSPVQQFSLVNARVQKILCGNQLIDFEKKNKRTRKLNLETPLPESVFFIGISSEEKKINLKNSHFYFELLDIQNVDLFYYYLQHAEFFFNNEPIDVTNNYYERPDVQKSFVESLFSEKSNKTITSENDILKNYKKHFFTINSDIWIDKNNDIPTSLEKSIDLKDYEELTDLNWIEVRFSNIISNKILQNSFCSLNAFPVMNRKLESITYQLKNFIDIIPLTTVDLFLDIKEVVNTSGQKYKYGDAHNDVDKKGTYTLRKDNIGKLDSRKAKEFLNYLIQLLKEESAAFSLFGNDFIDSITHEMNQNLALLDKKIKETNKETLETSYLSIKPYTKKETLQVDYWVTNGNFANQIKTGSPLQVYKGSEFKPQESVLITTSFNGKNELSKEERLYAYRRALLSRNRIITKQDLKSLCFDVCGGRLKNIEIKKGFRTNFKIGQGLTPTIDVVLYIKKEDQTTEIEWESIRTNILSIIEEQSIDVFPYHIILKK